MKKNIIALILSVVVVAGSIGTVPAKATETAVQEDTSAESTEGFCKETPFASEEEADTGLTKEVAAVTETEQAAEKEEDENTDEAVKEASVAATEQAAEYESEQSLDENEDVTHEQNEDAVVDEGAENSVDEAGENTVIEEETIEKTEEMPLIATVLDNDTPREGWDYDASTNTLTLTNYGGENVEDFEDGSTQIYTDGDLTLMLEGENTLSAVSDYGIYCDGELVIEGPGSLTINNVATGISAKKGITVNSGKISIADTQTGVEARYGDFAFNAGSLTVNNGIEAKNGGDVIIKGGEITANLISTDNDMSIEGGTINGSLDNYSEAGAYMNISDGTIDAESVDAYHFEMTGGEITASRIDMGYMDDISNGIIICNGGWNVTWGGNRVSGGNVVVNGYANWGYSVSITGGEIIVNGKFQPDSMWMSGGKLTVNNPEGNGVETGPSMDEVSISGGVVDITAGGYGIYVDGYSSSISITGGEVKIASGKGAMTATDGITISEFVKLFAGNDLEHAVETEAYYGEKCIKTIAIQKPIDMLTIIGIVPKTYTGSAIYQEVVVKNGATTLKNGTDYTLTYENNTNAGTASVVITGKGNYTGTVTIAFKITPKSVSTLTISGVAAKTYNGKAQTQAVVVRDGDTTLVNGTDYTLSYKNNINAGTAAVIITGIGNYTDSVTKNFTIKKIANTITAKSFTRTYSTKAQAFALGVKIKNGTPTYKSNSKYVVVSKAGKVTVKAKFIGKATITITAPASTNYTAMTKKITVTVVPTKTALVSVTSPSAGKMTVKWKKNAVGTGYLFQYSTSSKFEKPKTVTITKNTILTKTIGSLVKGKKYYVRIRTYKTVGSAKFYSGWSAVKVVTIRK